MLNNKLNYWTRDSAKDLIPQLTDSIEQLLSIVHSSVYVLNVSNPHQRQFNCCEIEELYWKLIDSECERWSVNTLSLAFRVMGEEAIHQSSFYDLIIYNNTAEDFGVPFPMFYFWTTE